MGNGASRRRSHQPPRRAMFTLKLSLRAGAPPRSQKVSWGGCSAPNANRVSSASITDGSVYRRLYKNIPDSCARNQDQSARRRKFLRREDRVDGQSHRRFRAGGNGCTPGCQSGMQAVTVISTRSSGKFNIASTVVLAGLSVGKNLAYSSL